MNTVALLAQSAGIGTAVGAVLPLLAAVVLRPHWSPRTKEVIVGALATLAATAQIVAQGGFTSDGGSIAYGAALSAIVGAAELAYRQLWQRFGVTQAIESATTPKAALAANPVADCTTCDAAANGVCLNPCGQTPALIPAPLAAPTVTAIPAVAIVPADTSVTAAPAVAAAPATDAPAAPEAEAPAALAAKRRTPHKKAVPSQDDQQ
jgi:hypothetical protein